MDEDRRNATETRELPILSIQQVRNTVSRSPSVGVSSPKREAEEIPELAREGPKRRRKNETLERNQATKAYEKTLEEDVKSYLGDDFEEVAESFRASGNVAGAGSAQYGAVRWSPREKALFFHFLDRRGRHDLPAIAEGIGTKSEPEVSDYLCLLQDAYRERHLTAKELSLEVYEDLPAAVEIDEELGNALNDAALESIREDYQKCAKREKKEHGESAIIDLTLAKDVSKGIKAGKDDENPERGSPEFSNTLLNVPKMLELSASMFMNSKDEDSNWRYIETGSDGPAVFQTCLVDLSNLVVSVTERLVASANFMALSRIRSSEKRGERGISSTVNSTDVSAALDVLEMPPDSWSFWVQCPRKCQLEVNANLKADEDNELSYDLVERALEDWSTGRTPEDFFQMDEAQQSIEVDPSPNSSVDNSEGKDDEGEESSMSTSSRRTRSSTRTSGTSEDRSNESSTRSFSARYDGEESSEYEEELELEEDLRADFADQQASVTEQKSLWSMLGTSRYNADDNDNDSQLPQRHTKRGSWPRRRKTDEELKDWKDWCWYETKWEHCPEPPSADITFSSRAPQRSSAMSLDSEEQSSGFRRTSSEVRDT